jgi:hypothetical protein
VLDVISRGALRMGGCFSGNVLEIGTVVAPDSIRAKYHAELAANGVSIL